MSFFTSSRFASSLPEPLKQKPGGLQPNQLRVYEYFARNLKASGASVSGSTADAGQTPLLATQLCIDKLLSLYAEMDKAAISHPGTRVDYNLIVNQVNHMISQAQNKEELLAAIAKNVTTLLFRAETTPRAELSILILERYLPPFLITKTINKLNRK